MIIAPIDPKWNTLTRPTFPAEGRVHSIGEPQRRHWVAHVKWDHKGRDNGTLTIKSPWLSGLLRQLVKFEQNVIDRSDVPDLFVLPFWQLHLYYPPELRASINIAVKYWCSRETQFLIQME